ncbi:acylneuraminate cytidylyltransferase [Nitrosopumilus sp.]|uniref:cytidylyltransferase domain-containing protein n=1 Tax=Nitrosopumilus sp. TaxID=2024843 RepID=UPI00247B6894|nr:acylneuraminate cytidylyltransferase [Nitrosopumilus sp.]MCV0430385.1 acylneuraminate cytidylyltransferase [Nitrosopumilus sp.]
MNFDIFIPVRLDSSRLPKKALLQISKIPILKILVDRLSNAKKIRNIVVCTTTLPSDDELVNFLQKNNIKYFRGSEKDILQRYLDAATTFNSDYIVNVDGDDIYTDPKSIDDIVEEYIKNKTDFIKISSVPLGLQSFGFPIHILKQICKNKNSDDTETGWIRFFTESNLISKGEAIQNLENQFPNNLRLSLDYPEDFEIAKEIFSSISKNFDLEELSIFLNNNSNILKAIRNTEDKWKNHWKTNLSDISTKTNEIK